MREIKFRGKSVDTKEWIYGGYYEWDNKSYIIQKDIWDRDIHTAQMIEVIPETVGQYIGVKDNNGEGEEIYEGDIIEKVFYSHYQPECSALFEIKYDGIGFITEIIKGNTLEFCHTEEWFVVDDIYKNKESNVGISTL